MYGEMDKVSGEGIYSSGTSNGFTGSGTVTKQSGIDREYSELTTALALLDDGIGELERRLSPVLRNEPPMPLMSGNEAREMPSCPLAESISRDATCLRSLNSRLTGIIRRIEL